jgi:hypothetical protein
MSAAKKYPKVPSTVAEDPRFSKLLRDVQAVWDHIGMDCEQCSEEMGEPPMTKAHKVEACLDADRLLLDVQAHGSHAYVKTLYADYGYDAVAKLITAEVRL